MKNIFSLDGPVFSFISRLADLCVLNLVWLITSLPVFTIGASTTAMLTLTIEMVKGNDVKIIRDFFKAFKANFKRATIIWLIMLGTGLFLGLDYYMFGDMPGVLGKAVKYLITFLAVYYSFMLIYIFAILPTYKNTVKNAFRNSVLLPFINLPYSLILLGLILVAIYVTLFDLEFFFKYGFLIWFMLGFATMAYLSSFIFVRVFIKDFPEWKEEMDENTENNLSK
ncbi:MAG: DUF624 domain-containing protein [Lachnospiraceae bacterium]|nr:DUF624 domain-containing protein [Lachnospiraceae bacterium]